MEHPDRGRDDAFRQGTLAHLPRGIFIWLPMACLVALVVPQMVHAQSAPPEKKAADVQLALSKVTFDADGTERLVDARTVKPGDVVEYQVTYTKTSGESVNRLLAALPVPQGIDYVPQSAQLPSVVTDAATANGQFNREPLVQKVKRPDGSVQSIAVPYPEDRALHWRLGLLGPDTSVIVKVRMRVEGSAAAAPAPAAGAPASR